MAATTTSSSTMPSATIVTPIISTPITTTTTTDRLAYLLEMRRRFCAPEMLVDITSAELNFEYFKPKSLPSSAWTEEDDATLMKALLNLPFGRWTTIRKDYLPKRDENELRLRCMQLLGVQNLLKYEGWRPKTLQDIDNERVKNLQEAKDKNIELVYGTVPDPAFGKLVEENVVTTSVVGVTKTEDDDEDDEDDNNNNTGEVSTSNSAKIKRLKKE
jgi:hypothetical protein